MDIVRLVEVKILSVMEVITRVLEGGTDYLDFERQLKKELDGLGCELLQIVLESLDQKLKTSEDRKRNWTVVRSNDHKEVLTPFGLVAYERTNYRHKKNKRYAYLLDEKIGLSPHVRVGANLKGELLQASAGMSYEGATVHVSRHNSELKVSKQTVAACVKEFKANRFPAVKEKRCVRVLYLEADEDHVKVKGHRGVQARLVYVHEGVEGGPRRRLKNVKYFTTVSKDAESFWLEICDYIEAHYDLESLEKIYLSGDGGSWIRVGQEYIPGVTFNLDKFHLSKSILTATAHAPELKKLIYRGIWTLNKPAVLNHLYEALSRAEEYPRQKRVRDTIRYIDRNWDGIESGVKHPHVGCSAEGHVSHVLAARLSSRPMAWSLQGAENMAAMRAVKANGESVSGHYTATCSTSFPIVELKEEARQELKRIQKRLLGRENLNNVPLYLGANSFTRKVLKGLNDHLVI